MYYFGTLCLALMLYFCGHVVADVFDSWPAEETFVSPRLRRTGILGCMFVAYVLFIWYSPR